MNYIILILVAIAGIIIGSYFSFFASSFAKATEDKKAKEDEKATQDKGVGLIFGQQKKKRKNKEKILEFMKSNEKITNNDVEKLCNVSNATAERYLNQLEKNGKLIQHGKIGTSVFYTLK